MLVFTDGDDTTSRTRFGTVLDRAQVEEVMVYAIGLQGQDVVNGRPVRTMPDRSLKTAGGSDRRRLLRAVAGPTR